MKVILLEDVKSLGKKGEIVTVSDAYARNVIFAKKLGLEATGKNLNDLKLQNKHADKVAQEQLEAAKALAKELEDKVVEVKMKAGEGGRTFGSVSTKEISAAAKEQPILVKKAFLTFGFQSRAKNSFGEIPRECTSTEANGIKTINESIVTTMPSVR